MSNISFLTASCMSLKMKQIMIWKTWSMTPANLYQQLDGKPAPSSWQFLIDQICFRHAGNIDFFWQKMLHNMSLKMKQIMTLKTRSMTTANLCQQLDGKPAPSSWQFLIMKNIGEPAAQRINKVCSFHFILKVFLPGGILSSSVLEVMFNILISSGTNILSPMNIELEGTSLSSIPKVSKQD